MASSPVGDGGSFPIINQYLMRSYALTCLCRALSATASPTRIVSVIRESALGRLMGCRRVPAPSRLQPKRKRRLGCLKKSGIYCSGLCSGSPCRSANRAASVPFRLPPKSHRDATGLSKDVSCAEDSVSASLLLSASGAALLVHRDHRRSSHRDAFHGCLSREVKSGLSDRSRHAQASQHSCKSFQARQDARTDV